MKRKRPEYQEPDEEDPEEVTVPKSTASREELKVMSGDLPVDVVVSYMKHMRASTVRVLSKRASFNVILPILHLSMLSEALKPGYTMETVNMNDTHLLP